MEERPALVTRQAEPDQGEPEWLWHVREWVKGFDGQPVAPEEVCQLLSAYDSLTERLAAVESENKRLFSQAEILEAGPEPEEMVKARQALFDADGGLGRLDEGIRSMAAHLLSSQAEAKQLRKDKDALFDQLDQAKEDARQLAIVRVENIRLAEVDAQLAALRAQQPAPDGEPCGECARLRGVIRELLEADSERFDSGAEARLAKRKHQRAIRRFREAEQVAWDAAHPLAEVPFPVTSEAQATQ